MRSYSKAYSRVHENLSKARGPDVPGRDSSNLVREMLSVLGLWDLEITGKNKL